MTYQPPSRMIRRKVTTKHTMPGNTPYPEIVKWARENGHPRFTAEHRQGQLIVTTWKMEAKEVA